MAGGIRIQPGLEIPDDELDWRTDPSGGPGGQHANRSNTRVTVRFDIEESATLTDRQRTRLGSKLGPVISITSDRTRSQSRNRTDAAERLAERIRDALQEDRPRRPTRPSRASKRRRLDAKKRAGDQKKSRSWRPDDL
ncbi:MAG: aminoacyl-tRNA hydrolase [Actinomycetia bacterium]|nr:aminoacyl-tRNA hydrolase [Actinomycetes bacterium]